MSDRFTDVSLLPTFLAGGKTVRVNVSKMNRRKWELRKRLRGPEY